MIKRVARRFLPRAIRVSLHNYRILSSRFGQYQTMKQWSCIDSAGTPVPWYTYPAIEYLKQLDFSTKIVFEYGSGNSTRFWAARCKQLYAVEDNEQWYEKIRPTLPSGVDYRLIASKDDYVNAIRQVPDDVDVAIIDGSYRLDCARAAVERVSPNGFLILDNSDWYENTSALLRAADLIEVDMAGFGPINGYTWTTSFYFRRGVRLTPANGRQPVSGIGSVIRRDD